MIRKYTDHHTNLVQTKTDPLRNKQISTECFNLKGAIFKLVYLHYGMKQTARNKLSVFSTRLAATSEYGKFPDRTSKY